MKHLYKFIGLFFLFGISLFLFGKTIPELTVVSTSSASLQESTFPLMYIQSGNYTINTLHGYSSDINSGNFRESITPLDISKSFRVKIKQNESKIKRLDYELYDIANKKIIETNTLTAFDTVNQYRTALIKISNSLDTSTEYGCKITLTTNYSKKINFYTRLKYYSSDCFMNKKLDFVKLFHNATFDKGKSLNISPYLDANTSDDSTFANVTIHSGKKLIYWKNLKPKVISEIVPTINEINIETASISYDYYIKATLNSSSETFHIKEYYRVRYSGNRIFLLNFKRTMEALFNPDLTSLQKSEFKIGVTNNTDLGITSSSNTKKVAFVRNGSLWYYDLKTNTLTSVFSFVHAANDYIRDYYDQHDIKILKIDNNGNISFMVYGYMNCGDYEGRIGILLYDYNAKENNITERVYIPLSITYQQLKEDIGDYCYVNDKNIFYLSINDTVYAYNIFSKRYDILSKQATKDHFSIMRSAHCYVWTTTEKKQNTNSITIMDLDTQQKKIIQSPPNENIVVFGTIDSNVVYGYAHNDEIYENANGSIVKPAYQLVIANRTGKILRKYHVNNTYIVNASIKDNVIRLKCVKKKNNRFVPTTDDSIMNQKNDSAKSASLTSRITENGLTEKYISLPAGYEMKTKPEVTSTKCVMITENTTLHFSEDEISNTIKYYIYVNGQITNSTTDIAKAIQSAYNQMGTVMDNKSHIVWERGGKFISKQISNISYPGNTSSTIKAATQMLLQSAQITTSTDKLYGKSILSMLKRYISQPVSLSGCTVDDILYFVSSEKPVIGMLNSNHAVLITEYNSSSITWMDPATRHSKKVSLSSAEKSFKNAGYKFFSFIDN